MTAFIVRREFITLLGGAAAGWPLSARAQQPAMPVIGFLHSASAAAFANFVAAFRKGLMEVGYVEGENVAIEYRWGEGHNERLPALAAGLVRQRVNVIVTPVSTAATLAAKAATATIPIVFVIGADPVKIGLVASLHRPGGNATGISDVGVELGAKRLGLLKGCCQQPRDLPCSSIPRIHLLPSPSSRSYRRPLRPWVSKSKLSLPVRIAASTRPLRRLKKRTDAFLISPEALFVTRRVQLVSLAARHALPALYHRREFTDAGGLMSYGLDLTDQFRQTSIYAGRILKGEKPAEMPVQLPTKFEFVLNLQAAKTLGLEVPPTLLARADEVIE